MVREQLKDEEKRKLNKESFVKLYGIFRYLLPYKTKFIIGLVVLILGSFLLLSFPFVAGKLIDVASGKGTLPRFVSHEPFSLFGLDNEQLIHFGFLFDMTDSKYSYFSIGKPISYSITMSFKGSEVPSVIGFVFIGRIPFRLIF